MDTVRSRNANRQIDQKVECDSGDIEIPSKDWAPFLEGFSRQHEGWLASISVSHGREKIVGVVDCQLQRITLSRPGDKWRMYITLLRREGDPVFHLVPDPIRLIFKRDPCGAHQGLEITSGDGRITILQFRVAARPETLDGVIPAFAQPGSGNPGEEFSRRQQNA